MVKKEIKVRDLAREFGIPSRRIVDRCRAEGWPVQNSITKLRAEWERSLRVWLTAYSAANDTNAGRGPQRDGAAADAARP